MIKTYEWKGGLWRFKPEDAPADAVEYQAKPEPKPKAKRTQNKSRSAQNKEA